MPRGYFVCAFLCGFLWALLRADLLLSDNLERELEGKTIVASGQVASLVASNHSDSTVSSLQFEFRIDELRSLEGEVLESPSKVRLRWYKSNKTPKAGEYWQLSIHLKRPYGFMNPGGFDYEGWLFQKHIRATGYVRNDGDNQRLQAAPIYSIDSWRGNLRERIRALDVGNFWDGLLLTLSLGDRSAVSQQQWQVLTQTGTSHLLAISGLHIGLIAGLFFFIGRWAWSASLVLPRYFASHRFAALFALAWVLLYAAMAGFSIPTQRALVMVSIVMLMILSNRRFGISYIISVTLSSVLIVDPFSVMSAGFWLSFGAVSVIAFGMVCRVNAGGIWWRWGRVQYLVAIGLMPLLLFYFKQYPLTSIPANMVAVPWVSLIVVPLVLIGSLLLYVFSPVGKFLLQMAVYALELLWPFLELLSSAKFSLWYRPSLDFKSLLLALVGVAILLAPRGIPSRWIGMIWLLPLLFPRQQMPKENDFWFTQLDVGQGLAAIVQTHRHTLVYDTGWFIAGRMVIVPYLRHLGVNELDMLVISHGDNDHIGGANDVLKQYTDTKVLTSVQHLIRKTDNIKTCRDGQSWRWDGVDFQVLHPKNILRTDNDNDQSCVLKVSNGKYSVLLSGDIEKQSEQRLLQQHADQLPATVLVVPHHGSRTSSSTAFIKGVKPRYAVFPVGYRNRFGFPKQDIMSRYEVYGITMFNTAETGAIDFRFENSGISINQYRQDRKRFWHTQF